MGLRVLCGQKGSGKTLYALSLAEQAVRAGRPTFTNIKLRPACPFVDRVGWLDDKTCMVYGTNAEGKYEAFWHYLPVGSVVIIDEADNYFDCADHGQMGKDFKNYHKQLRKLGHDLIYIVQRVANLNVRIRRLTDSFVGCEWNYNSQRVFKMLGMSHRMSRFLRTEFEDYPFTERGVIGGGYWDYDYGKRFFDWYWTKQLTGDVSFYSSDVLRQMGILEEARELSPAEAIHDAGKGTITSERNPFEQPYGQRRRAARIAAAALYQALADGPGVGVPGGSVLGLAAPEGEGGDPVAGGEGVPAGGPTFRADNAGDAFH